MVSSSAARNPPSEASDLLKVPMMMWTFFSRPKWLTVPAPQRPMTPMPWASSTMSEAR